MAHDAVIVELKNVKPHPNADRLKLAECLGYQVVVGLDSQEGDIGIFFYPELQLSEEYAVANDLIRRKNPITGENEGGMFDANRRVRSQKFRGEKSEGYFAPMSSLDFLQMSVITDHNLPVGTAFNELAGTPICNKYVTQATLRAASQNQKQCKRQNNMFSKHVETEKLQFAIDDIKPGSIIYITEKLHGTSGRYAYVKDKVEVKRTWKQKLLRRPQLDFYEWKFLVGTRNMILADGAEGYHGKEDFRRNVVSHIPQLMKKGEVIYGEIVGFTENGTAIMGEHDTKELKEIKKQYGNKMIYSYGCNPGECKFYVYRITQVNEDGEEVELSWPQVVKRSKELMLETVPYVGHEDYELGTHTTEGPFFIEGLEGDLDNLVNWIQDYLLEGCSILDESHIREGVVLRVEGPDGNTNFYKAKSFTFGVLEGYIKQSDDYVDTEEIS
jgi:RNA ligase (TIGR02306 family)